jgi:nucleoside-diphosphate-sugar epimerase
MDVQLAVGDLRDRASLQRAVEGCRYVFHCGALVSDWATKDEIRQSNVTGTRNLLEASAGTSVRRFIHFSSTDVYGYPGGAGVEETQAPGPFRNWYAQTKLEAEGEVLRMAAEQPLETVILRPATVYGPGSVEVVGEIARAIRGGRMLLIDGGRAVAGLCYVENLIDAALLAQTHEHADGKTFNVNDGLPVTWREFTDGLARGLDRQSVRFSIPYWLAHALGSSLEHGYRLLRRSTGLSTPALLSRQAVQVLGCAQDFSNRQAREVLGWEPRVDYASGLEATLEWLRTDYLIRD